MNLLLSFCVALIWIAAIYGFCHEDLGIGIFGRLWGFLAFGAITIAMELAIGGLLYLTGTALGIV
jgi:hypothetical protein